MPGYRPTNTSIQQIAGLPKGGETFALVLRSCRLFYHLSAGIVDDVKREVTLAECDFVRT